MNSTTAKGSAFEGRVYRWIERELADGRIGLMPQMSRLCRGKGYYSRDRGSEIVVDMSIELWSPGADTWSLLWAYECKDYSTPIPVSDVEEFKSKLDQISGANRKGAIASTGPLQKAALSYAKAHGIAVLRMIPEEQFRYIMHAIVNDGPRSSRQLNRVAVDRALTDPTIMSFDRDFFGVYDGRSFGSISRFMEYSLKA
jgi:hypothetical protein